MLGWMNCRKEWILLLGEGGRKAFGRSETTGRHSPCFCIRKRRCFYWIEATSALDNETERAVNEMLLGLMKECRGLTVLTIAHRESSLAVLSSV